MQMLTEAQCLAWLKEKRIPADPYSSSHGPEAFGRVPFIEQARLPQHRTEVFLRLVENLSSCGSALLHVTDWALYTPDEMSVFDACRRAYGEMRRLIEAPGHLFQQAQFTLFAGMLALIKNYGWVAYAYFDDGTTALIWKGEFLDLCSYEEASFQTARQTVVACGLQLTKKMPASAHPHPN